MPRALPKRRTSKPDAAERFVRAIGEGAAVKLFLGFGGSTIYLSARPYANSQLVAELGEEARNGLLREFGAGTVNIPLANAWTARQLNKSGLPRAAIARALRITRESVRGFLTEAPAEGHL